MASGDRFILVSDGVIDRSLDKGGRLGLDGIADAARRPDTDGAAATVRGVQATRCCRRATPTWTTTPP